MAVHFKWGREGIAGLGDRARHRQRRGSADVAVTDSCTGQLLAKGTTRRIGPARRPSRPARTRKLFELRRHQPHPLMISARKADDFSFALTAWGNGISPGDFDLPYG
jgi:hypothetical protein